MDLGTREQGQKSATDPIAMGLTPEELSDETQVEQVIEYDEEEERKVYLLATALKKGGLAFGAPIHLETYKGAVNDVYKFEIDGQHFGVRVRTREALSRYEPNLIKEVFAAWLLRRGEKLADEYVGEVFRQMAEREFGGPLIHLLVGDILYFDWTRQEIPFPYSVYRWREGVELLDVPDPTLYRLAGANLAELHRVTFEVFTDSILSVGQKALTFNERLRFNWTNERKRAEGTLETSLLDAIEASLFEKEYEAIPTLVHNDYFGANLIVGEKNKMHVIDWDNWSIDAPELDLIKMKYWTTRVDGVLVSDVTLYNSFIDGYMALCDVPPNAAVGHAMELLWLVRIINFERDRERHHSVGGVGYPPSSYYKDVLVSLVHGS